MATSTGWNTQKDAQNVRVTHVVKTRPATSPVTMGCATFLLIALVAGIIRAAIGAGDAPAPTVSGAAPAATAQSPIPYQEVARWDIPAGGHGRVLVVDSTHRNEADLRALGDQIRTEMAADRFAFVEVFDSERAADMRRRVSHLSDRDGRFFDRHKLADYTKNGSTGYHSITISPQGIAEGKPMIEVAYP